MVRPPAAMNALLLEIPRFLRVSTPPEAFQRHRNCCARLFAIPTVVFWLALCAFLTVDAPERREVVALAFLTKVRVAVLVAFHASFLARRAVYSAVYCKVCDSPVCEIVKQVDERAGAQSPPLLRHVAARFPWLFALMLVQSVSGFVLEGFESLIAEHLILSHFLTMLVGAGGNAGNQAAVLVIRGLA